MLLTPDDLAELTGKRRSAAQREVLSAMGIAYRIRPDGTLAVLRVVAELALGHTDARTTASYLRDKSAPIVQGPSIGRLQHPKHLLTAYRLCDIVSTCAALCGAAPGPGE